MDETPSSITPNQDKYIRDLVAKKDLNGNARREVSQAQREYLLSGDYSAMSKAQASKAIKMLLDLNDKPVLPANSERLPEGSTTDDTPPVPNLVTGHGDLQSRERDVNVRQKLADKLTELEAKVDPGYYFVVNPALIKNGKTTDPNDGERFYHVSKPELPSKWAGYTFIESRGGDFLYKVRDMQARIDILEAILVDPITAMNEYGIRLGVCGCCGRTLTAKDSRLRGLGPICAAKVLGAPTESQLELLDRLGLRKS